MPVSYEVLGELTVRANGQPVTLPGGAALRVFTALLMNANKTVTKASLLRAGWGPVDIDEVQLHKAISNIRTLLAGLGHRDDLHTQARVGYELRVVEADFDLTEFSRLIREAEAASASPAREIELLRQALRLWRGRNPLANVPGEAFRSEISALTQRRKRAAVRLFELEVGRGAYEAVLDDLGTLASYHPTDKRLTELLMLALYRCGHTTEALAAFGRHAAALERAGTPLESGPRQLRQAIEQGDQAAADRYEAGLRRPVMRGEPAAPPRRVPRQLPPAPGEFVGRDHLLHEAAWLLGRRRPGAGPIVVITGPGGVGKTTLARQVAHQVRETYPDGQLYVELHDTSGRAVPPEEVLAQFLRAFEVTGVPESRAERAALLRTVLAERRVLLVLDDAHDEAQLHDLIPGNADCGVIVTARRRMPALSGAHHVAPLEPLDPPLAMELFRQIVRQSGVVEPIDRAATERVVALCAGLPLAIRIAAALRVREVGRPTAELAERLARGPEAFAYDELSVARSIGASVDRLDPEARRLFLGLGRLRLPHVGLWTAAAVLGPSVPDPGGALSQLIASSILSPAGPPGRYRWHDLTQEYATRRASSTVDLLETDGVSTVEDSYRALLTLARAAHRGLYGGDVEVVHCALPDWDTPAPVLQEVEDDPTAWYEAERANLRAAVDHCAELGHTELAWDLAASSHEFFNLGGYFDDWYATHTVALRACEAAGDTRGEGVMLALLGQPALVASRRAGAVSGPAELERAMELLSAAGDRHGQAIAERTLANALRRRGQLARPLRLFRSAQENYEASGDGVGSWQALRYVGHTHLDQGEPVEAVRVLEQALTAATELGRGPQAQSRYWLGMARLAVDDVAGARAEFTAMRAGLPTVEGLPHAYAAHGLGEVARREGRLDDAEERLGHAARLADEASDAVLLARVHLALAELWRDQGRTDERVAALEAAAACVTGGVNPFLEAAALATLATAEAERGRPEAARAAAARVEARYDEMDLPEEDRVFRADSMAGLG